MLASRFVQASTPASMRRRCSFQITLSLLFCCLSFAATPGLLGATRAPVQPRPRSHRRTHRQCSEPERHAAQRRGMESRRQVAQLPLAEFKWQRWGRAVDAATGRNQTLVDADHLRVCILYDCRLW